MSRIIPAYAGSTSRWTTLSARARDHPRIRGEHIGAVHTHRLLAGSSPHTRGALLAGLPGSLPPRIIPAYAGSTSVDEPIHITPPDHPRIRGEHADQVAKTKFGKGSSPHTRGALIIFRSIAAFEGIIPAYAGSTRRRRARLAAMPDHPRIRGEHRPVRSWPEGAAGSSPHTRGARGRARVYPISSRIIPAYAGSTWLRYGTQAECRDHPRIRGEHESQVYPVGVNVGSSPHTRGARG